MRHFYRVEGQIYRVGGVGGIGLMPHFTVAFGLSAGWDAVRYFPAHDLTINGDGIGRLGYTYFGSPWSADVMGFTLDLPMPLGTRDFTVDYEWIDYGGGFGRNKHGIGWWEEGSLGEGYGEYVGPYFFGTWDQPAGDGFAALNGAADWGTRITPVTNHVGAWVWRRITRRGSLWRVQDGPSRPANGSYGESTHESAAGVSSLFGIKMAGTHRIREFEMRV